MSGSIYAFNTSRYEIAAQLKTKATLTSGQAVKLVEFPSTSGFPVLKLDPATSTDAILGVVPIGTSLTEAVPSRIVGLNAPLIPVLMAEDAVAGDYILVSTTDGKFKKAKGADIAQAQLLEDTKSANVGWAKPVLFKL